MLSLIQQADNLVMQGQYLQAESIYRSLLKLDKSNGSAYLGLGNIAITLNQFDLAISLFTQAAQLLPEAISPLLLLANAFNAVCSEQDAFTVLNYARERFPDSAQVQYHLAQQHLMAGQFEQAEKALRQVIKLSNGAITSHALFALVRCKRYKADDIKAIQQRLSNQLMERSEQTVLHYTLGEIEHGAQNHVAAWQHFSLANRLQSQGCDFATKEMGAFFADIKKIATSALLNQQIEEKSEELTPIFILGLPRSGSTLLEQMLARHPKISAGGELPYLSGEVDDYLFQQTGCHYPHSMQNASAQQLEQAAQIYLTAVQRHARNKAFVIDKLPANFQSIGLIYQLFPKAKVINLQRQPAAVAFSVFRNYFAQSEPYFCSLTEFKLYQTYYLDLMKHWHKVLPGFVLDVNYEHLITDTKHCMQAILAFCGIDWDNACLSDSQVHSPIMTLSNVEARLPIMNSIKKDWIPYQGYLHAFLPSTSEALPA
jgi:tetratricopeptide (TPR) repeat protein